MNKLPTAEELMFKYIPHGIQNIKGKGDGKPQYNAEKDVIQKCMIEFARLHLEAAVKIISEKADVEKIKIKKITEGVITETFSIRKGAMIDYDNTLIVVDKDSILNAYPLTNII